MKDLFRSPLVQNTLAALLAAYLRFCWATQRRTVIGQEMIDALWAAGDASHADGAAVVCFWHSRILQAPPCWPDARRHNTRSLISLSRDGEFIARAVALCGFHAIRGSSSKKSAPDKAKGGGQAFRDGVRWLKEGGVLAVTPDGPRGPAEVMAEGAPMFAQVSGAPCFLLGLAVSDCIALNTWDRHQIPLPFTRAVAIWEKVDAPRGVPAAELTALWGPALSAVTRRAEAIARGADA